jgi:hypothetical protein
MHLNLSHRAQGPYLALNAVYESEEENMPGSVPLLAGIGTGSDRTRVLLPVIVSQLPLNYQNGKHTRPTCSDRQLLGAGGIKNNRKLKRTFQRASSKYEVQVRSLRDRDMR